jgi:hypothetical protein
VSFISFNLRCHLLAADGCVKPSTHGDRGCRLTLARNPLHLSASWIGFIDRACGVERLPSKSTEISFFIPL